MGFGLVHIEAVHGQHWNCIADDRPITELLHDVSQQEEIIIGKAGKKKDSQGRLQKGETVLAKSHSKSDIGGMIVMVNDTDENGETIYNIWTGYPFCAKGVKHRLVLDEIQEWENGIEALITAYQEEGPTLTFFDPFFFKNKFRYKVGEEYEFFLAGMVYKIKPSGSQTLELPEHEGTQFLRKHLAEKAGKPENSESIKLNLAGMAALIQTGESEDDYNFSGPVKEVDSYEFRNIEFYRIKVTVARNTVSEQDLDINIYSKKSFFENGTTPQMGKDIEGVIWLQGYLVD